MRAIRRFLVCVLFLSPCLAIGQTAEELVAKNIQAHGGLEKIKAIRSIRTTSNLDASGFKAVLGQEQKRPDKVRDTFTVQGMTQIQAFDGAQAWQISPFGGRKDPELMGEEGTRGMVEEADFDGPLVDAAAKGNKVEYLGMDQVDGDDAYKLKCTLKNGDIFYYFLDPDTYLEIKVEKQIFIQGAVREFATVFGAYKPVNGVMFAFATASGPRNNPESGGRITVQKIEVNTDIDDKQFKMPSTPAAAPAAQPKPESKAPAKPKTASK